MLLLPSSKPWLAPGRKRGTSGKGQKGEGPTLETGGRRGKYLACDKKERTKRREGRRTTNKMGREGAWLAIRGKGKAKERGYWIEDNFPRRK
jgi:hypothetical protein